MTNVHEHIEDALDAASPTLDGERENVIVRPLSDDDIFNGGLASIRCFVRTRQSKEAMRKRRQRAKYKGKREINVVAADNEIAREFIRKMAAATVNDIAFVPVAEAIFSNSEYRSMFVDIVARTDVWDAVKAAWHSPGSVKKRRRYRIKELLRMAGRILLQSTLGRYGKGAFGWLLKLLNIQ